MSQTVLDPEVISTGSGTGRWKVVIFNNETNSMQEVVIVLMAATGCSVEEAAIEMWEAHTFGKAPVHFADREECEKAAVIIASIGIQTEVAKEWEE